MPSMNVGLSLGGGGDKLNVGDGTGQNQIDTSPQPITISWTLTGALAQADFVPMDAAQPGFSWVPPGPRAGIFGVPVIGDGGNSLSIVDNHFDDSSDGQWVYILRVIYNGKVYATEYASGPGGTTKNPVIINR